MKSTRRNFIKNSGTAVASAALFSQLPLGLVACSKNKKLSFGFQAWTIREQLVEDFPGTMKMMAEMGYSEIEMCSPLGYSNAGFEPLNSLSGTEMGKIINDAGLICQSTHVNMSELRDNLDNRIEWAHGVGITQLMAASFWLPNDATIDDYRRSADELNVIGEKTKKAGIQIGFHNHNMEFEKQDGVLIYDELLKQFDPELVKMQFQVAVINIGYKAADFFRKHPGRFISAHLSDYAADLKKQVPIGQGIVDWDDFFEAAKVGGVKNFFVEMAPANFKESAEFLASR